MYNCALFFRGRATYMTEYSNVSCMPFLTTVNTIIQQYPLLNLPQN